MRDELQLCEHSEISLRDSLGRESQERQVVAQQRDAAGRSHSETEKRLRTVNHLLQRNSAACLPPGKVKLGVARKKRC